MQIHKKFDSLHDLVEKAEKGKSEMSPEERSSRRIEDSSWSGSDTFETALSLYRKGWPEGLELIHKMVSEYKDIFTSYFPQQDYSIEQIHDVTGENVDVERAIRGEPENMLRFEETNKIKQGHKFQRIIVNCSYHAGISVETNFIRGGLITSLIDALEGFGFRTELVARNVVSREGGKSLLTYDTIIKQFDENPDIDRIAFVFANASFFRRFIFSIKEQENKATRECFGIYPMGGYGHPEENKIELLDNDLYFPRLNNNQTFEQQLEWFKQIIGPHFNEKIITE